MSSMISIGERTNSNWSPASGDPVSKKVGTGVGGAGEDLAGARQKGGDREMGAKASVGDGADGEGGRDA